MALGIFKFPGRSFLLNLVRMAVNLNVFAD